MVITFSLSAGTTALLAAGFFLNLAITFGLLGVVIGNALEKMRRD